MKSLSVEKHSNRQLLSTLSVDSYKDCPCPDFCTSWIWSFLKWFRYALMRLFPSRAGIEHFRVEWNNKRLLLFADMEAKEYSSAWSHQNAKAVITTGQKEILFCCTFNTMVSFSKLSCRCQGQCLVAKVA